MMKIRIKKCSAFIAGALFFLFCVQLAEKSLAEQFTLYIESDNEAINTIFETQMIYIRAMKPL